MRSILLIGASVGKDWEFGQFPSRAGLTQVRAEYRGLYQFDKTPLLMEQLQAGAGLPDAIILKECAAYFPMDQAAGRQWMSGWVQACRAAGVEPVPATVAPVLRPVEKTGILPALVRKIRGRPAVLERLAGILEFNDWIRSYAHEQELALLDLERSLRGSDEDRSLRPDLHSGDGLHLNRNAYSILDREMNRVVRDLFPEVAAERGS